MSIDAGTIPQAKASSLLGQVPAWLWLGIGVYALLLVNGTRLLNDSDTYWQIAVGQWILDHHELPRVDIYSFTRAGEPWTSSSWLAQVLFAGSDRFAGWTGPVVLAATCTSCWPQPASRQLLHCLHGSSGGAFRRPMPSPSRWRRWCFRTGIFLRVRTCWCCR